VRTARPSDDERSAERDHALAIDLADDPPDVWGPSVRAGPLADGPVPGTILAEQLQCQIVGRGRGFRRGQGRYVHAADGETHQRACHEPEYDDSWKREYTVQDFDNDR
jgi:hypothetical protein